MDAASTLQIDSDLPLTGSLVARGTVSFDAADVSVSGTYTQAAGTLSLGEDLSAPEVLIKPGATLGASNATIAGSLVNDGTAMLAGSASTREEIHHRGDRAADRRPGWISFRWLRQAGGQG